MALKAGFLIGGDTNETPQSLARKRALIAQIMANGRAPTTIGEGLNALGDGIVANVLERRASASEKAGQASANEAFAPIAAMFTGGGFGGSPAAASTQTPAAATTGQPPVPGLQSQGGGMSAYRDAIASIESKGSGDYAAVGPTHPKLGRALGRYQVMEANIGPWSQEVLGRTVTPEEFMANPQLQDKIFDGKFQSYVSKYGPEGAAQAWFGGPGGVGKTDRKDSLGTSIGAYGQKFTNALGGAGNAAEAVTAMGQGGQMPAQASAYVDPMVSAPNSRPQAMAPQQGPARNGLPFDLVSGSPQLARADTRKGILRAITGQAGPEPGATGAFPAAPGPSPMAAPQAAPTPSMAAPAQAAPQGMGQVSTQQLIAAINNPWLNDSQRAIAQSMLDQQMQANDPMRKLEMQKLQAEIAAAGNGEIKIAGDRAFRLKPDGTVEDVTPGAQNGGQAGGFRFTGSSVEAQALNGLMDSGQLTPEQAQQMAAGKTITNPADGSMMFLTPEGIFGTPAGGGAPQPVQPSAPTTSNEPTLFGQSGASTQAGSPAPAAPQATAPQRPGQIQLTPGKSQMPTEAERNRIASVNQAFSTITGELDRYAELVGKTGIEVAPGEDKDNLNAVRQGIMLQLKELFNLGVLNGPDLSLMERMIYDPTVDPFKEGGITNLPDQIWTGLTGGAGKRANNSVAELKRMLENIRSSVTKTPNQNVPTSGAQKPISEMTDEELEAIANGN